MNHDENNSEMQVWIDPEIEARVVAWVAGEASPFEIAQLERLIAEKPEIGVFKRRIEAVHGLVGEAVRPEPSPLRLASEKREQLLKALGAEAKKEPVGPTRPVVPFTSKPVRARSTFTRLATVAAGMMIGLFCIGVWQYSFRHYETPRGELESLGQVKSENAAVMRERIETRKAREEQELAAKKVRALAAARAQSAADQKEIASGVPVQLPATTAAEPSSAPAVAESTAPAENETANETVTMEPFVTTEGPSAGYAASSTLAGTRIRTDLKDIASAITVVPKSFVQSTEQGSAAKPEASENGDAADASLADSNLRPAFGYGLVGGSARAPARSSAFSTNLRTSGSLAAPAPIQADQSYNYYNQPAAAGKNGLWKAKSESEDDEKIPLSPFSVDAAPSRPIAFGVGAPAAGALQESQPSRQSSSDAQRGDEDAPTKLKPAAAPIASADAEVAAAQEPVSTFSLHVSDVSFRLAQAALSRGQWPDAASIRPEEFYNAFDYGDPAPAQGEKIACRIEQAAHPLLQGRNLVRIALRVPAVGRGATQPLRLTVLLDTSGSMEREDRAAAVHRAFEVLVSLLGPNDRITLIGFARQPHLLAEEVPGNEASRLLPLVAHTPAEGGTNLEEALKLGAELARRHQLAGAQNRLVLLTDGAANLGNADPARLSAAIETLRAQGLALDACGVGTAGIDDAMLEALTRKGDGRYYVLGTPESADAGFARQLAGAFRPAAENVKLQVRFNPARVKSYRLIGFEQHRLKTEDFRNDQVDAAELAAEENAVAVYQVEPLAKGEGEIGEVYVRFRDAATGNRVERSWTLPYDAHTATFDQASPRLQLAGAAALLAEKLRGGPADNAIDLDALEKTVNALRPGYAGNARVQQFVEMFEEARRLARK